MKLIDVLRKAVSEYERRNHERRYEHMKALDKRLVDLNLRWQLPYFFATPPVNEKTMCIYLGTQTTLEHFQTTLTNLMDLDMQTETVELSLEAEIDVKIVQDCKAYVAKVLPSAEISIRVGMCRESFSKMVYRNAMHVYYHNRLTN